MKRVVTVSAPGKLMIAGEYVVLDGAEALVAAVSARVLVRGSRDTQNHSGPLENGSEGFRTLPKEALLALKTANDFLGLDSNFQIEVSVQALEKNGSKLGLGSSSATAVAAAASIFAEAKQSIENSAVRAQLFNLALAAHRAVAPLGSGSDVVAATWGGFQRLRRTDQGFVLRRAISWPENIITCVVWTGKIARTSEFVTRTRAFRDADAKRYTLYTDDLRHWALRIMNALEESDASSVIEAVRRCQRTLAAFGQSAGVPIVTKELADIATLAERFGGASKPSGAGGGDVALAFFTEPEDALRFEEAAEQAGYAVIETELGGAGVREEKSIS